MFFVIDKKASESEKFTDFHFNDVASEKKALWHSKEDAYYGISCFIKDNHADDPDYSIARYEICEE